MHERSTRPQTSSQETYYRDLYRQVKPVCRLSCMLFERRFRQKPACVRAFIFYRTLRALKYKNTHARSPDGFDREKSGPGWFWGANYLKFWILNNSSLAPQSFPPCPNQAPVSGSLGLLPICFASFGQKARETSSCAQRACATRVTRGQRAARVAPNGRSKYFLGLCPFETSFMVSKLSWRNWNGLRRERKNAGWFRRLWGSKNTYFDGYSLKSAIKRLICLGGYFFVIKND